MTTTSRTAPSPTPDDPRLTAYVSGDLPPGEAETFAREVAADAATQAEVDRTRQFVAALEDALTSEPLPEPPHDTDVPLPRRLREQPVMRRRLSVFPALASALAIAACLVMVAALLLPTVGSQFLPVVVLGLAVGGLVFLRITGRIGTLTLMVALVAVGIVVLGWLGIAGGVRDG
ncbi:hypothetical protein OpiT1DRAFT_03707 [Opitutaceae bacterium TAV1]|nr:hypothetical protein OpiT1DRAFT_03707 [Opitutaceae bacterium TAV1]